MHDLAKAPKKDREVLFRSTASKTGMTDGIVEKDFWVCWTLDYLFHRSSLKGSFAFKGGTSLSKVFGLIPRFSEDIDLILDWRVHGYTIDGPCEERTRTQQDKLNKEINMRTEQYLANEFMQEMKKDFSKELIVSFIVQIINNYHQDIQGTIMMCTALESHQ